MYYDDEARRFNFVSGLLLGGVLGAGLALVASPQRRLRKPRRLRDGLRSFRDGSENSASLIREGMSGALSVALEAARASAGRRGLL
jgi:gas vesicle protein